jgi:hypothetical protein
MRNVARDGWCGRSPQGATCASIRVAAHSASGKAVDATSFVTQVIHMQLKVVKVVNLERARVVHCWLAPQ